MNSLTNNFKRKGFFEGWYFKHQAGSRIIAFIPSFNTDASGKSRVLIQIITNDNSHTVSYPLGDLRIDRKNSIIRVGNNVFSKKGMIVDIDTGELKVKGILRYGKMTPIGYTIMGIFQYFPGMECKHEIISMYHKVYGNLTYNGKLYRFSPGTGYMEKDRGYSFPESYFWIQCNYFPGDKCSVFISIADIPYHGIRFQGCICALRYHNREYRLATYLGVKIIKYSRTELCLKQGSYLLNVKLFEERPSKIKEENSLKEGRAFSHKLFAPVLGDMTRTIKEQHFTTGRFILYHKGKTVFDLFSREVSYEYVE